LKITKTGKYDTISMGKRFYSRVGELRLMSSQIREILYRKRKIVVLAVAIVAISSYLIPFNNLQVSEAKSQKCPPGFKHASDQGKYGIRKHHICQSNSASISQSGTNNRAEQTQSNSVCIDSGANCGRVQSNDESGSSNTGVSNIASDNRGSDNSVRANTGDDNTDSSNRGSDNSVRANTGDDNTGSGNTGHNNRGSDNTGSGNTGHNNRGSDNTGSGDNDGGQSHGAKVHKTVSDVKAKLSKQVRSSGSRD
jgi:Pentapeptide repeats (8 copies)